MKFRIYPTKTQQKTIALWLDLCRNLYNCALEERRSAYSKHKISKSYEAQTACLPEIKQLIPEYSLVYAQVLQNTLKRLDGSFQNFFRRIKQGEKPGYPRFKSYDRYISFTYPQLGFMIDGDKIYLSKIGYVPIIQHRKIEGKIKTCSVTKTNTGKYFVCLSAESVAKPSVEVKRSVGIDLGIKQYITFSNGTDPYQNTVPCIDKQLAKLQRQKERAQIKSQRRKDLKLWIARIYEKNANRRSDLQHKLSRKIVDKYDLIAMENLNIQSMQKSNLHGLNKRIGESAWNQLTQFIQYKAEDAGKVCVLVNPANTSQMCSRCGYLNIKKLKLNERAFVCESCGHAEDRDVNAAKNILRLGLQSQAAKLRSSA